MTFKLATTAMVLLATAGATHADKIKFEYWYGLTGDLGAVVAETCNRFNAAQAEYDAVCLGQDGYERPCRTPSPPFARASTRRCCSRLTQAPLI